MSTNIERNDRAASSLKETIVAVEMENGAVIYDQEESQAWIEASISFEISEMV